MHAAFWRLWVHLCTHVGRYTGKQYMHTLLALLTLQFKNLQLTLQFKIHTYAEMHAAFCRLWVHLCTHVGRYIGKQYMHTLLALLALQFKNLQLTLQFKNLQLTLQFKIHTYAEIHAAFCRLWVHLCTHVGRYIGKQYMHTLLSLLSGKRHKP